MRLRGRLLRLSLRGMIVIITVICILFAIHVQSVKEQQAAIKQIQRFGGSVVYDYEISKGAIDNTAKSRVPDWLLSVFGLDHFHRVVRVQMTFRELKDLDDTAFVKGKQTDDAMHALARFPHLRSVWLDCPQMTDASLRHLSQLKELRSLEMIEAWDVTDQGVANLANLTHLEFLHLDGSRISDESLKTLSGFPKLQRLLLQHNRFTDKGLSYLQKMIQLRVLSIVSRDNDFTDAGIECLKQLANLDALHLGRTNASATALRKLSLQLPNCQIIVSNNDGFSIMPTSMVLPSWVSF